MVLMLCEVPEIIDTLPVKEHWDNFLGLGGGAGKGVFKT